MDSKLTLMRAQATLLARSSHLRMRLNHSPTRGVSIGWNEPTQCIDGGKGSKEASDHEIGSVHNCLHRVRRNPEPISAARVYRLMAAELPLWH
jgi:hypothetical protein